MTVSAQNISKQIGMITRANREHSKGAASVLESLHGVRKVMVQNSEGARDALRGTQNLLDTVESLVEEVNSLNGNGRNHRRKASS
jgi:methyl-accepting chemotaxis protein